MRICDGKDGTISIADQFPPPVHPQGQVGADMLTARVDRWVSDGTDGASVEVDERMTGTELGKWERSVLGKSLIWSGVDP